MNKQIIASLKQKGYFHQHDTEYFSLRIIPKAGNMTGLEMKKVIEVSEKYGRGYVGFTTRQCVEIPWIRFEDTEVISKELEEMELISGGSGKRVAPIVSCKGTVCSYGLIDTQDLCNKLHDKYFGKELPAKFKIGIVGCPNNCVTAPINDLGFMGQRVPRVEDNKCKGCTLCMRSCKADAIRKKDKIVEINYKECLNCGKCIGVCPFKAMDIEKEGVAIYLGGKFGRKYRIGNRLDNIFTVEEVDKITEKVLNYYAENAEQLERFADYVERVGIEEIKNTIIDMV